MSASVGYQAGISGPRAIFDAFSVGINRLTGPRVTLISFAHPGLYYLSLTATIRNPKSKRLPFQTAPSLDVYIREIAV